MRFSLVLATVDRVEELKRFLASLRSQSYKDCELIVVDQNGDERLAPLLADFEPALKVLHLRSTQRGLSRARNLGLRHVTGDVVAFPDDDCWYPPDCLRAVADFLLANPFVDGITGRSVDEAGRTTQGRFACDRSRVDRMAVWAQGISYTIFLRGEVVRRIGEFDESLGVGSGTEFGSGEETDYLIRAVEAGAALEYLPEHVVHHPETGLLFDEKSRHKGFLYGCGMGRVLRKHRYPLWYRGRAVLRPIGGACFAAAKGRIAESQFYLARALGRIKGLTAAIG